MTHPSRYIIVFSPKVFYWFGQHSDVKEGMAKISIREMDKTCFNRIYANLNRVLSKCNYFYPSDYLQFISTQSSCPHGSPSDLCQSALPEKENQESLGCDCEALSWADVLDTVIKFYETI